MKALLLNLFLHMYGPSYLPCYKVPLTSMIFIRPFTGQPQLATANCVANLQWIKADGLFWDAPL